MTALEVAGLALLGVAILVLFVGVAVWAARDDRRHERARAERYRGH